MITEFYYGSAWRWPIQYLPRVMLSASFTRTLKKPYKMDRPWMMDSGIGGMFKPDSKPRLSIEEYAEQIEKWQPPIAWTYDYPCEPSIRQRFGYTITQAQLMTNANTIRLRDTYGLPVQSVIQGWRIPDYLNNIDKLKEEGLLTERIGIGSICRRGQTTEINRIIRYIKREMPGWVKLHGFGVKISTLKTEARYHLTSADSLSWGMEMQMYAWNKNNNEGLTWHEKVPYVTSYVNRIEKMINIPAPVTLMEALK